jgi:tRNA A22 N-methylase
LNIKNWKEWCVEIFPGFEKSNSMKITEEEIVEDLKRVYDVIKKPPTQSEYKKYGKYTGGVVFCTKTWNEWLMECFGEINDVPPANRKISNEDLIKNLQELKEKLKMH